MQFTEDEVFAEIGKLHMQVVKLQLALAASTPFTEEVDEPTNNDQAKA